VRVLALGDSCTFGRGVEDGEAWPARLEARLRAAGQDAAVQNAGVPGYGTTQERGLLRRLAPRVRPTHVVVVWLPNDAHETPPLQVLDGQLVKDEADLREWRARAERRGANASALYRFLRVRAKLVEAGLGLRRDEAPEPISDAQLATTQAPLRALVDEVRDLGARPLGVLLPREEELFDEGFDTSHHARMAAFAAGLGVDVVDLCAAWRARPPARGAFYLPRDPVHLSPAGYEAVAAAVAERLWGVPSGR
jgi:lysophospholipase L1-like esterase